MAKRTQSQAKSKTKRATLIRFLAVGLSALLVIILSLGALLYSRPVATINTVQSGLLELGGIKSKHAQVGPYRIHYLVGGDGPPLLLGRADRLIPYEVALRLQRELPQAKLIGLDGCSHLVLWECRDRALPEVLSFLE